MLNYDFIAKKSLESRVDKITIEREYWQLLFLQRLYLTKESKNLFFKGGTAIRFLLGSFRFSEDLDFTSTLTKKDAEALLLKTFLFFKKNSATELELKKEKVFLKLEGESLKYRFLFRPEGSIHKVSVRFDISLREKPLTKDETVLVPFDYPISPYPLIVYISAEEILAEKVRALFVRGKPRDLFDFWFLLTKKIAVNKKMVEKKFAIYPHLKFSRERLKRIIESYNEKELKKDLNQFLPEHYRNFYKRLKDETLKLL